MADDNFAAEFDPQKVQASAQAAPNSFADEFDPQKVQQYAQAPSATTTPPPPSQPQPQTPAPSFWDKLGAAGLAGGTGGINPDAYKCIGTLEDQQQEHTREENVINDAAAAQTEKALGAKYDPDALTDLQRTKIGLSPDNQAKANALKQMFPEGSAQVVKDAQGNEYVKVQKDQKSTPFILSGGSTAAWSEWYQAINNQNMSPGERANAFANAVSHAVEDNPREAAKAAVLTLLTGGDSLLLDAGRLVTADTAMNAGFNTYDPGTERNYTAQNIHDSVADGVGILLGLGAGKVVQGVTSLATGSGMLPLSEEGKKLLEDTAKLKEIGKSQGIPESELNQLDPVPGQVAESKLIKLYSAISSRLVNTLGKYVDNQRTVATKIFRGQYDPNNIEGIMTDINKSPGLDAITQNRTGTLPNAMKSAKDTIANPITPPTTTSTEAGSLLNRDLGSYADRSKDDVNALYNKARAIEEPRFDPTPALDAAAEAGRGTSTLSKYEKTPVYGTDTDAAGNPIQVSTDISKESTPIQTPKADLQSIIDRINLWKENGIMPVARALDNGQVATDTAMDQINALREQAWKLSQPGAAGELRGDEALAKKVYNGLNDVLNNAGNNNPEFQDAWKAASAAAKQRFDYLEDPIVRRGYKQDEGDLLSPASTSANTMGGQVENLQKLQQMAKDGVISPEAYQAEIDSQKRRLFADPGSLTSKLTRLEQDKPELKDILFPNKDEYAAYKTLADAYSSFKNGGIEESMKGSSNAYGLVDKLFKNELTTSQLNSLAKATPDSPLGKQLREAVLDHIYTLSVNTERGTLRMSSTPLDAQIKNAFSEGGKLTRLLTPEDKQTLHTFLNYFQGAEEGRGGLGSSIAAYGEASKIRELEHEALMKLVESFGFGKVVTSKFGQRLLYGKAGAGGASSSIPSKVGVGYGVKKASDYENEGN